jgi:hypothetical protein
LPTSTKDGDLDLFVVNYVDADRSKTPYCGNAKLGQRFYCHPLNYPSLPNTPLSQRRTRRLHDVSAASGIGASRGNGLGVVVTDYDEDGWPGCLRRQRQRCELLVSQYPAS